MVPPSRRADNSGSGGLNAAQRSAVRHGEGPLLVAAGAGSGKTRTLVSRLLALLKRGVPGSEILAITFTNKAADEMRERVDSRKSSVVSQPFIGTFHAFGAWILRGHAGVFGRTAAYSIYDGDDSLKVIKQLIRSRSREEERGPAPLRREFSKLKNEGSDDPELLELFRSYEELLRAHNAFDFDDLIEKPVRLFREHPETLTRYERRFRHVLVDEYQDINAMQYALVRLLSLRHGNICVVGDDNQSIYSFRGADFRNFLNFERDFPGARVVLLEENYRSSANIIRAASEVISNNTLQKPKRLWTKEAEGAPIRIVETSGPEEEGKTIAEFAAQDPGNTAVLYRTNAQSRAIEQALITEGIPYRIFGGLRFYDRKEVKDLVAALRFAHNPRDAVAEDRMGKAFRKAAFRRLMDELPSQTETRSPRELLGFVLDTTDYFASLRKHFENAEERAENIRELLAFAAQSGTLGDFLERIALLEGGPAPPLQGKEVRLTTIHLSKGLEFDRVAIAGAAEGYLPHQRSFAALADHRILQGPANGGGVEEERRLFYVAMTRARKELFITFFDVGSRFLYEMPQELVKFTSTIGSDRTLEDDEERYIVVS